MENNEDDMIPMQYLSNENPYAFCTDYHKNSINLAEKKIRLNALQKIQPTKHIFKMAPKHLETERNALIETAISAKTAFLRKRALKILGIDYHDNVEELLENYLNNEELLEIALELKKLKLVNNQKTLRFKVSAALVGKITEDSEGLVDPTVILETDNLKDALVYCKLEDLYSKNE